MVQDRIFAVPQGFIVKTGYVDVFKVRLACRDRMAVGDIDRAFQKKIQADGNSFWPPPNGQWDGDTFIIHDGRHEWVAAIMLGYTHLLVCWISEGE